MASQSDLKSPKDDNDVQPKDNYPSIILMGDSMLDNFYYQMDKKQQSVTSLLRKKYANKASVTNLAVDGCQSTNIIQGIDTKSILTFLNERKKYGIEPYPGDFDKESRIKPLEIVQQMIANKSAVTGLPKSNLQPTVILSVGMMDLKTLIPIQDESLIFIQMLQFEENLNQILKVLIGTHKLNVILLSLWEPYSEFYNLYETPRDAFVMVLNLWMTKLFSIAADWKLPVIDLTRTINTYDRSHYSSASLFENNSKSAMFIVDLIDEILNKYAFDETSRIYYSSASFGGIKSEINNMNARENYAHELKSRNAFKMDRKSDFEEKKYYGDEAAADDSKLEQKQSGSVENRVSKQTEHDNVNVGSVRQTHVILMGDSVLDNFYWLSDKTKDVKQQLLDSYANKIKVTNLAVDESTSEDTLHGMDPSFTYVDVRKEYGLEAYPMDAQNGNKVIPLKIIKEMIEKKQIAVNANKGQIKPTVVVSVGGNDVRVLLYKFDLQTIKTGLDKFAANLQQIIETVLFDLGLNIIPVLCYEPYVDFAADYGMQREQLLQVMEIGANKLFELSETYALPVIDLSRTFDPFNRKHYGSTSIEPSNQSGQYIVDLIQHISERFPFNSDVKGSKIYFGRKDDAKGIIEQDNNGQNRNQYLQDLLARKAPSDTK